MSKYPKAPSVQPEVGLLNQACCDCGLVHTLGFTVDDKGIVRMDIARNNRATAQLRRGEFPYLKSPRKGDNWKMVRIQK